MSVTVTVLLNGVRVPVDLDEAALAAIAATLPAPAALWPEWMSAATAARYLDISPERISKLKQRGRIPYHQEGGKGCRVFFSRCELDGWMGTKRVHSGGDA